jgi:hypothetical protein
MPCSNIYSAIFVLYPPPRHIEEDGPGAHPLPQCPRHLSAALFLDRSRVFLKGDLGPPEAASPFLLYWGYHTFRYYYYRHKWDGRPENRQALKDLGSTFAVLEKRWKLAGMVLLDLSHYEVR